ncbi:hypothetical protein H4V97_000886 [Flavobacterium sp. CG_23.5]|nr:hypothetical protein [Flavobacterium sp. CG_23.5]
MAIAFLLIFSKAIYNNLNTLKILVSITIGIV